MGFLKMRVMIRWIFHACIVVLVESLATIIEDGFVNKDIKSIERRTCILDLMAGRLQNPLWCYCQNMIADLEGTHLYDTMQGLYI